MRASGGRVKLLEKDDRFTAADVEHYLCVMLLMLPAANRQKGKDFLRMFRDSGWYPTLFPDGDDLFGDARLLKIFPDLEQVSENGTIKPQLIQCVQDAAPRASCSMKHTKPTAKRKEANEEFVQSVNRLNPILVIELSATPNRSI